MITLDILLSLSVVESNFATSSVFVGVFAHVMFLLLHSGRIVNVTSVKGLFVFPFTAAYTMTKFAIEAFSDALRIEMNKFGVTVTIVEPGNFGGATEGLNVCFPHYHFHLTDLLFEH